MPEIIIVNSKQPQKITTVYITPEKILARECLIGRDENCCVVLPDSLVSRIHGKIIFQNGSYYYNDLGSRNGSRLNNQLLKSDRNYPLNPSDALNLGSHLLWIKSVSEIKTNLVSFFPQQKKYLPLKIVEPNLITRETNPEITVRCVQIIPETERSETFSFVADPPILFSYQPGQFATIELEIDEEPSEHRYYLSSSPSRPHKLDLTIERNFDSTEQIDATSALANNWLSNRLKIGSEIKIKKIEGKFTCVNNPAPKLLFISAGKGIIPLMSMVRWLCDTASEVDLIFCHSARTSQDIIFRTELELMAAKYPNLKLAFTVTRPEPYQAWYGYTGRLNHSMLSNIAPDLSDRDVYVCGSDSFLKSVRSSLEEINFPMSNYYQEPANFTPQEPLERSVTRLPVAINGTTLTTKISLQPSKLKNTRESDRFVLPKANQIQESDLEHISSSSQSHQIRYHSLPPLTVVSTPFQASNSEVIPFPAQKSSIVTKRLDSEVSTVWLTESNQIFDCDRQSSILETAQTLEIDLPHGCGMGFCGHCQVKKLAGKVIYEEEVDCQEGYILTCLAKPVGQVQLEA